MNKKNANQNWMTQGSSDQTSQLDDINDRSFEPNIKIISSNRKENLFTNRTVSQMVHKNE